MVVKDLLLADNRKKKKHDLEGPLRTVFQNTCVFRKFGAHHENLNEYSLHCQRRQCCTMTLDSGNMRFMRIFAAVLKIYVSFLFYAYASILRIHVPHAFFVIKFNCYCLLQLSTSVIFVNENENENEKDQQFVHENEN